MRADLMKQVGPHMTARGAALMVLASDREISLNTEATSIGKGRTIASLKLYNPKINHEVLYRLIKEGLVEQDGFKFRLLVTL